MLNKDNWDRAYEILQNNSKLDTEYGMFGGVQNFEGLTFEGLQQLLQECLADPNEAQNKAPSIGEIYEFIKQEGLESSLTLGGYIVESSREDTRISIDTIESCENAVFDKNTREAIRAFVGISADEDIISYNSVYLWWD